VIQEIPRDLYEPALSAPVAFVLLVVGLALLIHALVTFWRGDDD